VQGLTYVELSLQTQYPALYWLMFISVFVMNTCFAIDAFREGRALASAKPAQAGLTPRTA
jgi:hypothetical protein